VKKQTQAVQKTHISQSQELHAVNGLDQIHRIIIRLFHKIANPSIRFHTTNAGLQGESSMLQNIHLPSI